MTRRGPTCTSSSSAPPAWSGASSRSGWSRTAGSAGATIAKATLHDVVEPQAPANAPFKVRTVSSDFAEPGEAEKLVAERPDVIFHLAAIVSGEAEADFDKGYRINLDGTRQLFDADPQDRRRLQAAARLHLVDRGLRRALPGGDRRRVLHDAADQLRHAEGDRRAAARRLLAARLLRRHRHPAADDLRAAGQAQQGGVGLLLQHHPRAAGRAGGGAAGRRGRAPLARHPALGGRLPHPCRDDRHGAASGTRRNLTMPGLSVTVAEQIEALRRVAGDKVADRIRREPDPVIIKIVAGWARKLRRQPGREPRLQGREELRRDHPRPYRGRARREVGGLSRICGGDRSGRIHHRH